MRSAPKEENKPCSYLCRYVNGLSATLSILRRRRLLRRRKMDKVALQARRNCGFRPPDGGGIYKALTCIDYNGFKPTVGV
jgi:hypothetical protein